MSRTVDIAMTDAAGAPAPLFAMEREGSVVSHNPLIEPELSLLLTIAQVELPEHAANRLQELLKHPLRWHNLESLADVHGLEPLLFHHLSRFAGTVPAQVLGSLRERCRVVALRNLLLSTRLCEISAHLTFLQIEHIAYKGPLLAELYGGNGALRTYRDLDLLVPQAKLKFVRDALSAKGFKDRYGLTESQQAASFLHGFEHSFKSADGIDVDVHWRVVQEFKAPAFDMPGMWSRSTNAVLLDRDIPSLSQEDLFVVLCLHAGHHGWRSISHLCDLAQVLRSYSELNWEIVRSHLGDSNTRRIVAVTIALLHKHWNCEISPEVSALVAADAQVTGLADRIEREIWPSLEPGLTTSNFQWLLNRSAGERLSDRLRLVAGTIFVPATEDFALADLSPALSFLYAGLRAMRLVIRYASSIWRSDRGKTTKYGASSIEQV